VKLPLQEAEQQSLLAELATWAGYVSSSLLGVEALRACARYGEEYVADARSFLADVALLPLDDAVLEEAALIDPAALRSLDALHLATALSIRSDIGVFITYDQRLGAAAAERGLAVSEPS
jgi:predicted nucleic acid-binding protein